MSDASGGELRRRNRRRRRARQQHTTPWEEYARENGLDAEEQQQQERGSGRDEDDGHRSSQTSDQSDLETSPDTDDAVMEPYQITPGTSADMPEQSRRSSQASLSKDTKSNSIISSIVQAAHAHEQLSLLIVTYLSSPSSVAIEDLDHETAVNTVQRQSNQDSSTAAKRASQLPSSFSARSLVARDAATLTGTNLTRRGTLILVGLFGAIAAFPHLPLLPLSSSAASGHSATVAAIEALLSGNGAWSALTANSGDAGSYGTSLTTLTNCAAAIASRITPPLMVIGSVVALWACRVPPPRAPLSAALKEHAMKHSTTAQHLDSIRHSPSSLALLQHLEQNTEPLESLVRDLATAAKKLLKTSTHFDALIERIFVVLDQLDDGDELVYQFPTEAVEFHRSARLSRRPSLSDSADHDSDDSLSTPDPGRNVRKGARSPHVCKCGRVVSSTSGSVPTRRALAKALRKLEHAFENEIAQLLQPSLASDGGRVESDLSSGSAIDRIELTSLLGMYAPSLSASQHKTDRTGQSAQTTHHPHQRTESVQSDVYGSTGREADLYPTERDARLSSTLAASRTARPALRPARSRPTSLIIGAEQVHGLASPSDATAAETSMSSPSAGRGLSHRRQSAHADSRRNSWAAYSAGNLSYAQLQQRYSPSLRPSIPLRALSPPPGPMHGRTPPGSRLSARPIVPEAVEEGSTTYSPFSAAARDSLQRTSSLRERSGIGAGSAIKPRNRHRLSEQFLNEDQAASPTATMVAGRSPPFGPTLACTSSSYETPAKAVLRRQSADVSALRLSIPAGALTSAFAASSAVAGGSSASPDSAAEAHAGWKTPLRSGAESGGVASGGPLMSGEMRRVQTYHPAGTPVMTGYSPTMRPTLSHQPPGSLRSSYVAPTGSLDTRRGSRPLSTPDGVGLQDWQVYARPQTSTAPGKAGTGTGFDSPASVRSYRSQAPSENADVHATERPRHSKRFSYSNPTAAASEYAQAQAEARSTAPSSRPASWYLPPPSPWTLDAQPESRIGSSVDIRPVSRSGAAVTVSGSASAVVSKRHLLAVLYDKRDSMIKERKKILCCVLALRLPEADDHSGAAGPQTESTLIASIAASRTVKALIKTLLNLTLVTERIAASLGRALRREFGTASDMLFFLPTGVGPLSSVDSMAEPRHPKEEVLQLPGQFPSFPVIEVESASSRASSSTSANPRSSRGYNSGRIGGGRRQLRRRSDDFAPRERVDVRTRKALAEYQASNERIQQSLQKLAMESYKTKVKLEQALLADSDDEDRNDDDNDDEYRDTGSRPANSKNTVAKRSKLDLAAAGHEALRSDLDGLVSDWQTSRVAIRRLQEVRADAERQRLSERSSMEIQEEGGTPELSYSAGSTESSHAMALTATSESMYKDNSGPSSTFSAELATPPFGSSLDQTNASVEGHRRDARVLQNEDLLLDETNPAHLPPAGLEELLFEAFPEQPKQAPAARRTPSSALTREERIELARQKREHARAARALEGLREDGDSADFHQPLAQAQLVDELKGVVKVLRERKVVVPASARA